MIDQIPMLVILVRPLLEKVDGCWEPLAATTAHWMIAPPCISDRSYASVDFGHLPTRVNRTSIHYFERILYKAFCDHTSRDAESSSYKSV